MADKEFASCAIDISLPAIPWAIRMIFPHLVRERDEHLRVAFGNPFDRDHKHRTMYCQTDYVLLGGLCLVRWTMHVGELYRATDLLPCKMNVDCRLRRSRRYQLDP